MLEAQVGKIIQFVRPIDDYCTQIRNGAAIGPMGVRGPLNYDLYCSPAHKNKYWIKPGQSEEEWYYQKEVCHFCQQEIRRFEMNYYIDLQVPNLNICPLSLETVMKFEYSKEGPIAHLVCYNCTSLVEALILSIKENSYQNKEQLISILPTKFLSLEICELIFQYMNLYYYYQDKAEKYNQKIEVIRKEVEKRVIDEVKTKRIKFEGMVQV